MTRVQQTAAAMLFVAVLILGGWAWSQDDPATSPSDVDAANPAAGPPTAERAPADNPAGDDANAASPATSSDAPLADAPHVGGALDESPQVPPMASLPDRRQGMILSLWIFVLAVFLGIEVISKVPPTLHTPLMSGSNAISGITLVGAVIVAAAVVSGISPTAGVFARFLGFIAVALAMINAVGGFLVTHRMLAMFTRK